MANYYFMECCLEHQKTRIIEECNLMGCEGKHHFQEHFIEKKDDRKKLVHFYCLDRKQLGGFFFLTTKIFYGFQIKNSQNS